MFLRAAVRLPGLDLTQRPPGGAVNSNVLFLILVGLGTRWGWYSVVSLMRQGVEWTLSVLSIYYMPNI